MGRQNRERKWAQAEREARRALAKVARRIQNYRRWKVRVLRSSERRGTSVRSD